MVPYKVIESLDNGVGLPYSTEVVPQLFQALVCWFPDSPLLVRMVVAQDMWWWLRRICGGRVLEETKLRLTQPSLVELRLGLSLAIYIIIIIHSLALCMTGK
jgi:hypothetical protein